MFSVDVGDPVGSLVEEQESVLMWQFFEVVDFSHLTNYLGGE